LPGSANGGSPGFTAFATQIVRATWLADGRIWFPHQLSGAPQLQTSLVSVRPTAATGGFTPTFGWADEVAPSPDGRWVAFQEADDVFLAPLPLATGETPVRIETERGQAAGDQAVARRRALSPVARREHGGIRRRGALLHAITSPRRRADTVAIRLSVPRLVPRAASPSPTRGS
jgi:hypothetical protein